MHKFQSTERQLRKLGILALILLIFLTACGTGGDSPSVSPTRESATPTPEVSPSTASAPAISTAVPTETAPTGSPDPERAALTALYDSTGGGDWKINDGWLGDGALDKWLRVTTDENGHVTDLDLSANRLNGEIPAELGNLSRLELLYISDNNLTGSASAKSNGNIRAGVLPLPQQLRAVRAKR